MLKQTPTSATPEALTPAQIEQITGFSAKHLTRLAALGLAPKPFYLGHRTKRWFRADIEQWLMERHAQRDVDFAAHQESGRAGVQAREAKRAAAAVGVSE